MSTLWNILKPKPKGAYDFRKLIDYKPRDNPIQNISDIHIICDIDKTYLETDFESLFHMAKVAFESANDKVTVSGASEFLLAARWGSNDPDESANYPRNLHFVSSSPPQLRSVLEKKLNSDGLDWNSETFKDQAYNVKQRRFDMLKNHIGYKTAAILKLVKQSNPNSKFYLIGDNSESDAFIYLGVTLLLRNKLSVEGFKDYLEIGGAAPFVAKEISQEFSDLPEASVEAVLIRQAPNYEFTESSQLTDGIRTFDNYLQAAFILTQHRLIPSQLLFSLCRTFHNKFWFQRSDIVNHLNSFYKVANCDKLKEAIDAVRDRFSSDSIAPKSMTGIETDLSACDFSYLDNLQEDHCLELAKKWSLT